MNRLLIVDNEDYVVEGLLEVFRQLPHMDLEAIGAYSAKEALDWLTRTKIDIVVSDIRMPGMDGLALQREIARYWPNCKVVFLSGFNDFDYAQHAIRGGAIDYVLKTDGDERLIEAVEKAAKLLREEIEIEKLIVKSKNQMRMASEALQQDFVKQLLNGERVEPPELARQFADLCVPLHADMPVLAVMGRLDDWLDGKTYYDRYLLVYSIRNIAAEYLDTTVVQISVPIDRTQLVWLIQPKGLHPASPQRVKDDTWSMIARFVLGTFELIQSACKDLLKLEMSFLMAERAVPWAEVGGRFASLKANLASGLGFGRELLLVEERQPEEERSPDDYQPDAAARIGNLTALLENNRRDAFLSALDELMETRDVGSLEKNYYMAASVMLSFHRKEMVLTGTGEPWDLDRLLRPELPQAKREASVYLRRCGESIFDYRERSRGESEDELLTKVKKYVASHLSAELSLTGIAEFVGHNSSYLSRLFKQKNGVGLAEYIADCRILLAKELLAGTHQRIQDISSSTGFTSVQYFYRVFKKVTGMTPQEWRDAASSR